MRFRRNFYVFMDCFLEPGNLTDPDFVNRGGGGGGGGGGVAQYGTD